MSNYQEPIEAFPYTSPTDEIKAKYAHIFALEEGLPERFSKTLFDKVLALMLLSFSLPILLLLKFAYVIEGILIPENRGPMLFYYWGVSGGKKMKKWKLRLIKTNILNLRVRPVMIGLPSLRNGRQIAELTSVRFAKKWYLDELPQFWSVLIGDMSIVGPRPLSVLHYERDKAQGNVTRSLLKGGLLGLGHINKGTSKWVIHSMNTSILMSI